MLTIRVSLLSLIAYAVTLFAVSPSLAFKPEYHDDFTREALSQITRTIEGHTLRFTEKATQQIVDDNKNQDNGWCIFGTPSPPFSVSANHFDSEELHASSDLLITNQSVT